ncbi:MAG: hypothetical protein EPO07_12710, partial [Verrucomicrobia bacterium]
MTSPHRGACASERRSCRRAGSLVALLLRGCLPKVKPLERVCSRRAALRAAAGRLERRLNPYPSRRSRVLRPGGPRAGNYFLNESNWSFDCFMEMKLKRNGLNWRIIGASLLGGILTSGLLPCLRAAEEADVRRDAKVIVIEQALPSVVSIATATIKEIVPDQLEQLNRMVRGLPPLPAQRREEPSYIGSGVIIDEEGYLLTNSHVVEGASRVQVKLTDGRIYNAAVLLYRPGSDIALLK